MPQIVSLCLKLWLCILVCIGFLHHENVPCHVTCNIYLDKRIKKPKYTQTYTLFACIFPLKIDVLDEALHYSKIETLQKILGLPQEHIMIWRCCQRKQMVFNKVTMKHTHCIDNYSCIYSAVIVTKFLKKISGYRYAAV